MPSLARYALYVGLGGSGYGLSASSNVVGNSCFRRNLTYITRARLSSFPAHCFINGRALALSGVFQFSLAAVWATAVQCLFKAPLSCVIMNFVFFSCCPVTNWNSALTDRPMSMVIM